MRPLKWLEFICLLDVHLSTPASAKNQPLQISSNFPAKFTASFCIDYLKKRIFSRRIVLRRLFCFADYILFAKFRSPSPRGQFSVEVTFMVTKKLTDWLAGLVSEIPKRTSENDVRLVNLTALIKISSQIQCLVLYRENKKNF